MSGGEAESESAAPFVPESRSLRTLAGAVQPGDKEDLEGEPFVGPAGRELRAALERAGIAVDEAYLTNAVKHFKWRARGKRRLHQTPRAGEIEACKPWLGAELEAVRPEREEARRGLVEDLRLVAAAMAKR